jgi:hypothetical protein
VTRKSPGFIVLVNVRLLPSARGGRFRKFKSPLLPDLGSAGPENRRGMAVNAIVEARHEE